MKGHIHQTINYMLQLLLDNCAVSKSTISTKASGCK